MPTRDQVRELLDQGHTFETIARELHVPAGQAFMIATGVPADASNTPAGARPPLPGSSQALVNPAQVNPTGNPRVAEWVRERAARELRRPS